jgi:hypothetical protein
MKRHELRAMKTQRSKSDGPHVFNVDINPALQYSFNRIEGTLTEHFKADVAAPTMLQAVAIREEVRKQLILTSESPV